MTLKTSDDAELEDDLDELKAPEQSDASSAPTPRRWINVALRWTAVVLFAAVLAAAGYEGWLLFQQHQKDRAAGEALEVAQKYAVTLTTADPKTIDDKIATIISGATGEFKDKYAQASSQLRKLMLDNNVTTSGSVVASAVKSATPDTVEVMLFVKQDVSNSASPGPGSDLTAVTMTMEKVNGQWLASKVDLPGGQAP